MSTYTIRVDGPATIYVGSHDCTATAYALMTNALGVTESGVQISYNTKTHRVNCDDMGGSEGDPAELLVMGGQATIRGVMVKVNESVLADLRSGLYNTAEGSLPIPGTPLFAGGFGFGVTIVGAVTGYYFPKCELASQPREWNVSSQETKTSFSFTAYPIYTQVGSGPVAGHVYFRQAESGLIVPECSTAYGGNTYQT